MRHSFEAHSSSPNFIFTCGVNGCPQTFSKLSGMMSHLSRKHKGVDLDNTQVVSEFSPTSREENNATLDEGMDVGQPESTAADNDPEAENKLERSAALFLISLKERFEITQSALDFAVFQVQQMIEFAVEDVRESIKNTFLPGLQGCAGAESLPDIEECFHTPNPFTNLQSEYLQSKYYRQHHWWYVHAQFKFALLCLVCLYLYFRNLKQ